MAKIVRGAIGFTSTMSFGTGMAWGNIGRLRKGRAVKQLDDAHFNNC